MTEAAIIEQGESLLARELQFTHQIVEWPVAELISRIYKMYPEGPLPEQVKGMLKRIRAKLSTVVGQTSYYHVQEKLYDIARIDILLFRSATRNSDVDPVLFPCDDLISEHINSRIEAMREEDRDPWFLLIALSKQATGSKPTRKYLSTGSKIMGAPERFCPEVLDWLGFLVQQKDQEIKFVDSVTEGMLKGIVWLCTLFDDRDMTYSLGALAERCYKKGADGFDAVAISLGNACMYALANTKGMEGIGILSRLKLRIKRSNAQTLIDKYLREAAELQGVTVHAVEDMAVEDHGLVNGRKAFEIGGCRAVLSVPVFGETVVEWFAPDGKPQKSVPAVVKEQHGAELRQFKEIVKQLDTTMSVQRERLDRMLRADRTMDGSHFETYYFSHGVMGCITRMLIWNVTHNGATTALFNHDGQWMTAAKEIVEVGFEKETSFSLWHPALVSAEAVTAWREFFLEKEIVQPLKQAFREVYLLTDAERNTKSYSNRMAAHLLKQHQFNSLVKARGWKYSLLGHHDDGRAGMNATVALPDHGLRAEYWIHEVAADNAVNATGMWLYVATHQVRFVDVVNDAVVDLSLVPVVAFSEVMRDTDLFVGVASVGNDPEWSDGGGTPAQRDYWASYSFGDLGEVAKTRKAVLQRLLPRLKIGKVAEITDRFLVVKGKLRTYKIHLGSTNILMEPNDQYLCIVPDSGARFPQKVFLPFEGDSALSIILSKAIMLADDDKIKDETITRQIIK